MEELEERVLQRLLKFCSSRNAIGPYVRDGEAVIMTVDLEPRTFTRHKALSYLLEVLEQNQLDEEFRESMRTPVS